LKVGIRFLDLVIKRQGDWGTGGQGDKETGGQGERISEFRMDPGLL